MLVTLRLKAGEQVWNQVTRTGLHGYFARRGVTVDETAPGLMGFVDDLHSVLLVLGLAREGELVLGLAIGDLVDPGGVKD